MSLPRSDVAVVLVTFNRAALLRECLEGILAQTLSNRISAIYVIDNASSDNTQDLMRESYALNPQVKYIRMPENVGGAGGFHHGIREAHRSGAPWIWTLDDDVEPESDCLERMLSLEPVSDCIHPLVVYQDGSEHQWEHLFDPITTLQTGLRNRSFANGKDWCSMNVACFEGMLIKSSIVDKIGYPLADFFVFGDDGHYGYMASMQTNVIYTNRARLIKKIKPNGNNTPFKIYYDIRNRLLLRQRLKPYHERASFHSKLFWVFILIHSWRMTKGPNRASKLRAAWHALRDGGRQVTGRHRY